MAKEIKMNEDSYLNLLTLYFGCTSLYPSLIFPHCLLLMADSFYNPHILLINS